MLIITLHNDGTGTEDSANYNCGVRINRTIIAAARVEGHKRSDGWRVLVKRLLDAAIDVNQPSQA